MTRRGWKAALACALVVFAFLLAWRPGPRLQPGWLEMTAVDVGQGESLFVGLPDGKTMMVDGGGLATYGKRPKSRLDIGEDVVSPYLWSRGIQRLDVVVSTHAHEDHMGGLAALIDNFHPTELWAGPRPETPEWKALRAKAVKRGMRVTSLSAGACFRYGGAEFEFLAPPADYVPGEAPQNNDSLVLRLTHAERSFLLTGDSERLVEQWLLKANARLRSDVLKLAHHGSRTSSSEEFLDAVRPAFAIISAGLDNPHHNPHPQVLARLAERHVMVLRTDRAGLVSISTDGRRFRVFSARPDTASEFPYR